jgi:hypothetical protein
MMRMLLCGALIVSAAFLAPPSAESQLVELYAPSDTALVVLTGDTETAQLRVSGTGGISAYDITVFLDDSRVQLVSADTLSYYNLPPPTITPGTNEVQLTASGTGRTDFTMVVAELTFQLNTAAVEGSLLSFRVNSLTAGDGTTDLLPSHRTSIFQICQAEQIWGDLDGTRTITSRDALIAITGALGLPVGEFDLTVGDADRDSLTTTRDALFILSYAVGLYGDRAGTNRLNRCAPLAAAPADLAFWRNSNLWVLDAGDTIPRSLGLPGYTGTYPTWAPDGSEIIYTQSVSGWGWDFIRATPTGSIVDTLFVSTASDHAASYSPDGTQIAFMSTRATPYSLYLMNADGSNQVRLTDTLWLETDVRIEWRPDGNRILFRAYSLGNTTRRLWTINPDGTGVAEIYPNSGNEQGRDPTWSPAGDTVAYDYAGLGRIYRVAATGDSVGVPVSSLTSGQDFPGWLPAGVTFRAVPRSSYEWFLLDANGRHLRLFSGASSDIRASWRR